VQTSVEDTPETAGKFEQKLPVAEGQRLVVTLTADDTNGSQNAYISTVQKFMRIKKHTEKEVVQTN
jgi:hypothetical protein